MGGVHTSFFDGLCDGKTRSHIEAIAYVRLRNMQQKSEEIPQMKRLNGNPKVLGCWKGVSKSK